MSFSTAAERIEAENRAKIDAQSRFDAAYKAQGLAGAPPALQGESTLAYRTRLASRLQPGTSLKNLNFANLPDHAPGGAGVRDNMENIVIAESMKNPGADLPRHQFREIQTTDRSGRVISTFVGNGHIFGAMSQHGHRVTRFNIYPNQRGSR